jgi:hypothetical protein
MSEENKEKKELHLPKIDWKIIGEFLCKYLIGGILATFGVLIALALATAAKPAE